MSAKDFKIGEVVIFDGKECYVRTHPRAKKCLALPMPMGWFHFLPVDWNDVKKIQVKLPQAAHIIFTFNGKVYSRFKNWGLARCEAVLTRLGATYWEIG
jgi:hypothetical protein